MEKGSAPGAIVATKYEGGDRSEVKMTRPLCPYPQVAKYKGGDSNDAANFVCAAGVNESEIESRVGLQR